MSQNSPKTIMSSSDKFVEDLLSGSVPLLSKAAGLRWLSSKGLTVPDGFVILPTALQQSLQDSPDHLPLAALTAADICPKAWKEIEQRYHRLVGSGQDAKVAVRSSGGSEDGAADSHAGIYETVLNVDSAAALRAAVLICWQSRFNDRAKAYKPTATASNMTQSEDRDMNFSVIVQTMVPAVASGVMFTRVPKCVRLHGENTSQHLVLVEAALGFGEKLVSGEVHPERYVLAPTQDGAGKQMKLSKSGLATVDAKHCCLPLHALDELANTAVLVEAHKKCAMDLEFAWDGEVMWLLQCRPITTETWSIPSAAKLGSLDVLANKTTIEVMPQVLTPMNWSAFNEVIEAALTRRYAREGVMYPLHGNHDRSYYELRQGRLYQNVSLTVDLAMAEFGIDRAGAEKAALEFLPAVYAADAGLIEDILANISPSLRMRLSGTMHAIKMLLRGGNVAKKAEVAVHVGRRFCKEHRKKAQDSWYLQFHANQDEFTNLAVLYLDVNIHLSMTISVMKRTLQSKSDQHRSELIAQSLVSLGDVITAELSGGLRQLAEAVHSEATLLEATQALLERNGPISMQQAAEALPGTSFFGQLQDFIDKFGHKSEAELEVSCRRWSEDLRPILVALQKVPESRTEATNLIAAREKATEEILHACSLVIRPLVRVFVTRLQSLMRCRENLKDVVVRFIALQRWTLLQLAAETPALKSQPEDIFFLMCEDLKSLTTLKESDLRARCKLERQKLAKFNNLRNPSVYVGQAPRSEPKTGSSEAEDDCNSNLVVRGVCGSPGRACARVVVVPSLADASAVQAGDIIVVHTTNPAWTPLFSYVSAVISETGGVLSHAAIVARELGIPALLETPNACTRLKTGWIVDVNASAGVASVTNADIRHAEL